VKLSRAFLVALACAAAFTAFKLQYPSREWRHPYVPPKENPDGTIDYTLIAKPLGKWDGDYWVLRFPKDWKVTTSENAEAAEVKSPNGYHFKFNVIPNDWLTVDFDYPSLTPQPKDTPEKDSTVTVRPGAYKNNVVPSIAPFWVRGCEQLGEVFPGVLAFKQKTPAASDCITQDKGIAYVVVGTASQAMSEFSCTDDWLTRPFREGKTTVCSGSVRIFRDRNALTSIDRASTRIGPEEIKKVTEFARQFLEQTTVKQGTIKAFEVYKNN
jgi:hypothetical protein